MKQFGQIFLAAARQVLARPRDWLELAVLTGGFFMLFVMLPVWTTPGNDFFFQLSIIKPQVYVIMSGLAVLNALVLLWQIYYFQRQLGRLNFGQASRGLGAVAGSILATLGCASCYSGILAVFGLSGVVFLVKYRLIIALFAAFLAILALEWSSDKIVSGCRSCRAVKPE